jgi:hypothetical protein
MAQLAVAALDKGWAIVCTPRALPAGREPRHDLGHSCGPECLDAYVLISTYGAFFLDPSNFNSPRTRSSMNQRLLNGIPPCVASWNTTTSCQYSICLMKSMYEYEVIFKNLKKKAVI